MGCSDSKSASGDGAGGRETKNKNGNATYPKQQHKPVASVPPQKQEAPPPAETKAKSELSDDEIKKRVNRYMEIEKEILAGEAKNVPKALQAKKEQVEDIRKTLVEVEKAYRASCEKVSKEKADVDKMQNPSVRAFFKDESAFNEKMSKEQEEYLEAVSEQEVAKKQLDGIVGQSKSLEKEVQELTKDMNKLMGLYEEQDEILDDIFSGTYGSEKENQLEQEVDQLLDRKERIGVAKYKWANGRRLLYHATDQLGFATRRWQTLATVAPHILQVRYQLATETRNNLIAASQNITSAKRYLNNIKFPYCEPEELQTLDKAIMNVYIDMQTPDRHQHALHCYSVTYRRSAALLQWFDSVIQNTIEKDLAKAKADLTPKEKELRKERLQLMKEKIGGDTSDLKISDKDISDEFDDDALEPELMAISQPDKVEGESGGLAPKDDGLSAAPTPLPLNELAPPPSQEDLFGNIEQLKKQHEQDMAQIEKAQETNRARMEQGLQEKLRRRRSNRRRMMDE